MGSLCQPVESPRYDSGPAILYHLHHRLSTGRDIRIMSAWAPVGMGKRGHLPPPSGNVVKVFYFHNLSSASGGKCALAPQLGTRWGTFVLRPRICPPLEKILRAPMNVSKRRAAYTWKYDARVGRRTSVQIERVRSPNTANTQRNPLTILIKVNFVFNF